ncbi:reverse transcriptase domain-containing protein [Tanacetum coccineum]
MEDQPYAVADSPIALSPGYVADSDPEEDPEEDSEDGPVDYPADGGDGDDDDSSNDDEEEEEASEEEEEEHLALADSVVAPVVDHVPSSEETEPFETDESAATPPSPPACHTTARISIRPEAPMPFPSEDEVERLLALPPPPPSPLISLSPPSAEERLARCLAAPALPSSPLPIVPHPYGSPNHVRAPPGFRAAMGRLRASSPSTHHPLHPSPPLPPPPSSLHLPPHVPTSLPLPSSPLPPLPASLFIPPPVDRREDTPEAELPPRKRLCLTALTLRYEVGESSTAVPRPAGGHGIDYGFIGTLDAETRWVNDRVTELAAVQEQDTQDIYAVIEDTQDRQTRIFQSVEALIDDRQYHNEITRLLDQEALVSRDAWAHSMGLSLAIHYEVQGYRTHAWMQDHCIDAQDSLIAALTAQVSSLQGHLAMALGEIRALQARDMARADALEGTASTAVGLVFSFLVSDNHNNMPPRRSSATARAAATAAARAAAAAAAATPMTAAAVEQLIKARVSAALANHETLRNITNGHGDGSHNSGTGIKGTIRTPRVVVLAQWFEKMESVFHISNCAVENQVKFATCTFVGNALTWWNSHMKAVTQDVAYAMDWKTLKKMMTVKYCPRGEIKKLEIKLWNLKVKDEAEKYVGGLPNMIRGNVMQAEQKRKLEYNAGNNQGHQQQNKRQNTRRAYTAGPGEKREYTGSLPLCIKCNYHHKGPCAPRCNKCKKISHLARDCRSSGPNGALQERLPEVEEWKPCSLIPLSRGSFDVIVGMDWLSKRNFVIVCHDKVVRIPLEGDETLQVHGERTQGVVKTLMNTKVDEPKLSDISIFLGARHSRKSHSRLAPLEMQELSDNFKSMSMAVHLKLAVEYYRGREKCNAKYTKE